MNFFQCHNKLFFSNKKELPVVLDEEGQQAFVPYMTNRWLSFRSKSSTTFVNNTLNKFVALFGDNKDELFNLYLFLIPKSKFVRINYAKKKKKEVKKEEEALDYQATNMMISQRELTSYVDYNKHIAK